MLKRKMLDTLLHWRANKGTECLLIKGARQVGKSFIVEHFGRREYDSYLELDFIKRPELRGIFQDSLDPDRIYQNISLLIPDSRFVEKDTLIFLDEIQECPEARSALKYLAQDGRYDVIASGSLLGIQYREATTRTSIPVGTSAPSRCTPSTSRSSFGRAVWKGKPRQTCAATSTTSRPFPRSYIPP